MEPLGGGGTDSHTDGELPSRWREATEVTAPRGPFKAAVVPAAIVLTVAGLAAASSSLLALHGGPVGAGVGRATPPQLPSFHAPVSLATRTKESMETYLTEAFEAGGTQLHVADARILEEGGEVILIDMTDPYALYGHATVARVESEGGVVTLAAGIGQDFPRFSAVVAQQEIPTPAPTRARSPAPTPAPKPATAAGYDFVGPGWCRPGGCDLKAEDCRVGGFYKDNSHFDECNSVCNDDDECVGFGISTRFHNLSKDRCYVHTRVTGTLLDRGWTLYDYSYHEIATHSFSQEVSCYRKTSVEPAATRPAAPEPAAPEPEQPFPWIMCLLWACCALLAVAACFCLFQVQHDRNHQERAGRDSPSTRTTSLTQVGSRQLRVESIKDFHRGQMVVLSSDNGSEACLVSRVEIDHIVLQDGAGQEHPSGALVAVGELRFAEYDGELEAGDDLDAVGQRMTIEAAKEISASIENCVGFTYNTDTHEVWFKSTWRLTERRPGWKSFKKDATCEQ